MPWEDGLRTTTAPGSFEWWYFDADLDDGSTVVVVYYTKPILERIGPVKPCVQVTITRPDGRELTAFPVYAAAQFHAAQEACKVEIGPNWARGDLSQYQLHAEAPGLSADLTFTGLIPPWRPGTGELFFDEAQTERFGWLPAISFGTVEGTLLYDGQQRQVAGTGYHDHNWGNVGLEKVFSHWYWGRAHIGDYTLVFAEMVGSRAYGAQKVPVFMLAQGDRILTQDGGPLRLETGQSERHPSGKSYPCDVTLLWQSEGHSIHIAVAKPQIIKAISMLDTLPRWKHVVARLFANPYYFRFKSQFALSVDVGGVHARETGPALWELMILR